MREVKPIKYFSFNALANRKYTQIPEQFKFIALMSKKDSTVGIDVATLFRTENV